MRDRVMSVLAGVVIGIFASAGVTAWRRAVELGRTREALNARADIEVERRVEAEKLRVAREEREKTRQERIKTSKLVALTFDDGPSRAMTGRLLDILDEKGVKATFFVVGNRAMAAPELVQREAEEGHEVGSHTTSHVNFSKVKSAEAVAYERDRMRDIIVSLTGKEPVVMRPPYGNGIRSAVVTENIGLPMIYWSVDTLDWKYKDPNSVLARTLDAVYDGAIILMHDIHPTTVEAVPDVIDRLRELGYEFVTIPELARIRGVEMVAGRTYFYFKP